MKSVSATSFLDALDKISAGDVNLNNRRGFFI